MLEEEDRGVPIDQGEEVYQEVLGSARVVQIGKTEIAKLESRWRPPEERGRRLNRQQRTRVQVILRTEQ